MDTAETIPSGSWPVDRRDGAAALLTLALLVAAHFLVDLFASTVNPLWPALERHLAMESAARCGSSWPAVRGNFVQPACFRSLGGSRLGSWLLWWGRGGILCLSSLGLVASTGKMAAILVCGDWSGGFPSGGGSNGWCDLAGPPQSRDGVFSLSGYLGQAIGPYYAAP